MEEEEQPFSIDALYEKAKAYTDTTLELAKLKAVDKVSNLVSSVILRLIVLLFVLMFLFCANVALALWLGALTGQWYYGFLLVAGFYVLLALVVHFFMHKPLKKRLTESLINSLLN